MFEEAQRVPIGFVTNEYGNHMLAKPIRSLDSLLLPKVPVTTTPKAGYRATPLIPVPQSPKSWAEKDVDTALNGETVTFDPKADGTGDVLNSPEHPLYAGAAVEKSGGGRVVVIGNMRFI